MNKRQLIRKKSAILIIISLVLNIGVYYISRLINVNSVYHNVSTPLDEAIPFIPAMIVIYILAYVSWVVGFILLGREENDICYQGFAAHHLMELISMAFFILVPTAMVRPEIIGGSIFEKITEFIYLMDTPDNLFPSLHCANNWFCFRISLKCDKVSSSYKIGSFVMAILVFASTVFIKQHMLIDIIGAVIVVELALAIAKKFNFGKIYLMLFSKLGNYEE